MPKKRQIWVVPSEGLKIPILTSPRSYLPKQGASVEYHIYWERLSRQDAVAIFNDKKEADEAIAAASKSSGKKAAKEGGSE